MTETAPRTWERNAKWRGDRAGYGAIHDRIRKRKGPASGYPCVTCGKPANQWAYDHADPNEKTGTRGPFSLDPDHYDPLCYSCHRDLDKPEPLTHCRAGHELAGDNLRTTPLGERICRECRRERLRRVRQQTLGAAQRKRRWTDADLAIARDRSLSVLEAAFLLNRTVDGICHVRRSGNEVTS